MTNDDTGDEGAQLGLFGGGPPASEPVDMLPNLVRRTRELVVVRDRGHLLAAKPGPGRCVWTARDFFDRVRELAFDDEDAVLDDSALVWASAASLMQGSAWSVRIAPDIAQLARALIHAGADASEVHGAIEGQAGRLAEIGGTFQAVARAQQTLARAGVIDSATALFRGTVAIEQGTLPLSLRGFSRVTIRGVVDPSAMELRALVALARVGLPLTIVLPHDDAGRGLAEATGWILDALEAAHDAPNLEIAFDPIGHGAAREFLDAWYQPQLVAPKDAPVRVEISPDPASEARRIASLCARWRREGAERIAVTLRSLDAHADRIADALEAVGLAVRRRRGRPLSQTSAGRTLLDLITVRRDGAPRDRVLSVLAQPAFVHHLPCDEVGALASTLRRAVARTDVEDATRPEGGYKHRLERTAALDLENGQEQKAAAAREALTRVQAVLDAASRIPRRASLRAYLTHTLELVHDFILPDSRGEAGALVELLERWRRAALRVEAGAPKALDRETELAAYARFLMRGLWDRHLPPDPVHDDAAIEILSLPEMYGRSFDHVVVADCVHGRLPLAERPDPLLSDSDRAALNQAMGRRVLRLGQSDLLEPGPLPARQALEPLWFAAAISAAESSVYLSAAAQDTKGDEAAPSVFLEEALIALGATPDAMSAGPEFLGDPHPRDVRVRAAHHLVRRGNGSTVATFLSTSDIDFAKTCFQMRLERENFFARGGDPKDAAPFAFAIDPRRLERRFGSRLGLSADTPLTPTRLEALAACRFRGYVTQLLRVDTEREAGQDGDARQLGTLAHEVLEHFFRRRQAAAVPVTRMTRDDEAQLRALVDERAEPLRAGKTVGHLAALDANIRWLASALVRTVTTLSRHPPVKDAEPVAFEVAVGVPSQATTDHAFDSVPLDLSTHRLYFGGVIDRVDRGPTSRVVIDYKNSTASAIKHKLWGDKVNTSHFQLPLYLRLLEHNMPSDPRRRLYAYLVSLRDGTVSDVLGAQAPFRRRVMDDFAQDGLVQGLDRVLTPLLQGKVVADEGYQCSQCRCARACRLPPNALSPGLIDDGHSALPVIDDNVASPFALDEYVDDSTPDGRTRVAPTLDEGEF